MATRSAPPAIPSVETGLPSGEWSESVLASSPIRDTHAPFSETPARTHDLETAEKMSQAEPQASKTLKRQLASYSLSSKDTKGPHFSLPSTELKGAQPSEHTGGVGALPGNLSESSVALLPDERQERAQELSSVSARQRRDTIKPSAGVEDDEARESMKETEAKIPRDATLFKDESVASEMLGVPFQRAKAEVGEADQGDVAAAGSQAEWQQASQEASGGQRGAAGALAITEESSAKDLEQPDTSSKPAVQTGMEEESKGSRAGKLKEGYGGDYHPATLHPPPPGASAAECQSPVGTQREAHEAPITGTAPYAGDGAEKKPGFMTMVKGEMKILAGKVRGDEGKVAEGKRLVHGEA